MKLSALTSSLPLSLPETISAIAELGFQWIDVPPTIDSESLQLLHNHALRVACVPLEREQPVDVDLASEEANVRKCSCDYFKQCIAQTAKLKASVAYVTPPVKSDNTTLSHWTDSLISLADCAQTEGIRLGVEHFPSRALPSVATTLQFLEQLNHNSLALLIDVGHCLISREDPAQAVVNAGDRLGYIHFDDNDGVDDHHWALLDGRLTEADIISVLDALRTSPYDGPLSIELNPELEEPLENLRRSRDVLNRCFATLR